MDAIVQSMAFMLENKHYWEGVQDVGGEYHHGGGFLPLGVWKTLGFEAAHIEPALSIVMTSNPIL